MKADSNAQQLKPMQTTIDGNSQARFLVLDGLDGCGKSTQAALLVERLSLATGRQIQHLREPGTTPVGEALRSLLLDADVQLLPEVEALLFLAARRTLLNDCVAPALARGEWVVCERFHASTFAYQGIAGGLGGDAVLRLCKEQAGPPIPDLELILDIPLAVAVERRGQADEMLRCDR